jgi:hypothetical protein
MGYLDNSTTTVEAILTKKGRELLAKGAGFSIQKFAVADDEVDYTLYTTNHPLGSNFYGSIIESMPLIEASPDETQVMKYKLVTLPRNTKEIPIINIGYSSLTMTSGQSNSVPVKPGTTGDLNGPGFGYTAILYNSDAATIVGSGLADGSKATVPTFLSDAQSATATVVRGTEFSITPKDVPSQVVTQITFIGNQTGASVTLQLTVNPKPTV